MYYKYALKRNIVLCHLAVWPIQLNDAMQYFSSQHICNVVYKFSLIQAYTEPDQLGNT